MNTPSPDVQGPAVHVVAFRVATSLDGTTPVMAEAASSGETAALVTTRFEVVLDRYLDARTAIRQAICIRSDTAPVAGFDSCSGGIFLRPQYDPTRRVVTYYQEDAATRLAPDTLYTVTVLAPRDGGDLGIRAFDGAPLEASRTFLLRATDVAAALPTDAPAEPDAATCATEDTAVIGVLATKCAGCHSGSGARNGLSLIDQPNIEQTAFEVAKQTQMGGNATDVQVNPARFGADMAIIAPGSPGSSYLLYKVLARVPVDPDTLADGETDRLLGGIVVGAPMAPDFGYDAYTEDELVALADWIQRGAGCPQ